MSLYTGATWSITTKTFHAWKDGYKIDWACCLFSLRQSGQDHTVTCAGLKSRNLYMVGDLLTIVADDV